MTEPEDEDLGSPIDLQPLLEDGRPSPEFLDRLRRRIARRQFGGDMTTFFWAMPGEVLRGLLVGIFGGQSAMPEPEPDDEETPDG